MKWVIADAERRDAPSCPRFVPTESIAPGFNTTPESDPWEENVSSECDSPTEAAGDQSSLRDELEAWDAASDEALENFENSLLE
jgi:hypothetical protein